MAEVEEPQFSTLAERIAALNRQKNFKAPPPTLGKRAPPPPPALPVRAATTPTLAAVGHTSSQDVALLSKKPSNPSIPPRPVRALTEMVPPPLPRRTTEQESREATPAHPSGRVALPPPLPSRSSQQTISPALPSRRPSNQNLSASNQNHSGRRNSNSSDISYLSTISNLSLNQTSSSATSVASDNQAMRRLPPALEQARLPPLPPTRRELEAKAKEAAEQEAARDADCLLCRDFSAPDAAAAQHPIHSLPRQDPVGYLAHVLCDPFPSPTDKARAIFTWFHHNIEYDVDAFFGGCIPRGQTPAETIFSGKAVCEGYARVFEAIALRAGLQVVVIGGHGKGFGHNKVGPGHPVPKKDVSGHAWNAVRIDGGEWKLVDVCWGAGHITDDKRYVKAFAPEMFVLSNEIIGRKHYPGDSRHFYRADGRVPSWEEYILGEEDQDRMECYGEAEGMGKETFMPRMKKISVGSGEVVRFQFGKICEHWTFEKHGGGKKPFLYSIAIHGRGGQKKDMVFLETDGFWWWCDIPAADLGNPGQLLFMYALDKVNDKCARGMTKEEFYRIKTGGKSWGYSQKGMAKWELVE
ncbi:hypothetical protein B0T17DRAFT_617989 [Bombardia bombarda]|uniref:Transglutaminase-like domain-containing protein n=1 Tax=Bombardia bombarda TaxID=252184 RepID=A0AA39WU22_9PEZI|nr:hypothetical protein B0T17DRAFT_617989 [Bombardia bombarda]